MKKLSVWTLGLAVLVGTAFFARTKGANNISHILTNGDTQSTTAAFRDGLYLGKLAAQSGEAQHVATSRWASEADRKSFADGYQQAYLANLQETVAIKTQLTDAAFRDGLYLGQLDAKQGSGQHIASGRWSTDKKRASFVDGYNQAYNAVSLARVDEKNWP